jgi:ABC-type multidrug transport system ATPase subunit
MSVTFFQGISLSGGQKQRVNICRAMYSGSDILIFDVRGLYTLNFTEIRRVNIQDPLSALDAHVGESVFNNVLLDNTSNATRILVTHALHFLPKVDYIYFIADGRIVEQGTFDEMMENRGDFARTFDEFVTKDRKEESKGEKAVDVEDADVEDADVDEDAKKRRSAKRGAQLMQAEERNVGAVNAQVYKQYFQSGNGLVLLPLMFVTIVLMQAAIILSYYWCVIITQDFERR